MKMQKSGIFVKKILKINIWKIKDIVKLEIIVIIQDNIEVLRIAYAVPIEKEVDKNGEEITKNISHILQFIDSARFLANSLANLVNNLSEGGHRITCKYGYHDIKCETCRIKYKYCSCFL